MIVWYLVALLTVTSAGPVGGGVVVGGGSVGAVPAVRAALFNAKVVGWGCCRSTIR